MHVGVLAEQAPREHRVALTPAGVASLVGSGHDVSIESGAGSRAGLVDHAYRKAGAGVATRAGVSDRIRRRHVASFCPSVRFAGHTVPG